MQISLFFVVLIMFFCSISHEMDDTDKLDVHAELRLQLSDTKREITQSIESDINQETLRSIDSTIGELSAGIPTYCTDDY